MANALKCDRCGSYFDYNPNNNNFIAFGHKDIVVGRDFPTKDICPDCMELFTKWFEKPDNRKSEDCLVDVRNNDDENRDPCKRCVKHNCQQCR